MRTDCTRQSCLFFLQTRRQGHSPKHTEATASVQDVMEELATLLLAKPSEAMVKHGLEKGVLVEVAGNTDKGRVGSGGWFQCHE